MKIKLGVIFGGESVEHEVSIITAVQAMNKIDNDKYEIIPIYITKDRKWYTGEMLRDIEIFQDMKLIERYAKEVVLFEKEGRFILQNKNGLFKKEVKEIDIAFPIVHGTNVEDGVLQGYLTTIGIPFVGIDTYSGVVGQDKVFMKDVFKNNDIPVVDYVWFYDTDYINNKEEVLDKIKSNLKFPVIVKPATLGSSIGINKAKDEDELIDAIEEAIKYDKKIDVEQMVTNLKEVNISVLGNYENQKVSAIEEVNPNKDVLTFEDKYISGGKGKTSKCGKFAGTKSKGMASLSRKIPADLDTELKSKIEDIAVKAFKALGSSGVVRIDFMIDEDNNNVYINEINSIPGSLSFYLWEPLGVDYTSLLEEIISTGIKEYRKRISKTHSFESNILKGFSSMNGVKGSKGKLR